MPDENFILRQIDQTRTDFANLEAGQEFLMQRVNALPTASDLWRVASLIGLIGSVVGIVGIEWLWHHLPACGPTLTIDLPFWLLFLPIAVAIIGVGVGAAVVSLWGRLIGRLLSRVIR
jgi:polyferredoxin